MARLRSPGVVHGEYEQYPEGDDSSCGEATKAERREDRYHPPRRPSQRQPIAVAGPEVYHSESDTSPERATHQSTRAQILSPQVRRAQAYQSPANSFAQPHQGSLAHQSGRRQRQYRTQGGQGRDRASDKGDPVPGFGDLGLGGSLATLAGGVKADASAGRLQDLDRYLPSNERAQRGAEVEQHTRGEYSDQEEKHRHQEACRHISRQSSLRRSHRHHHRDSSQSGSSSLADKPAQQTGQEKPRTHARLPGIFSQNSSPAQSEEPRHHHQHHHHHPHLGSGHGDFRSPLPSTHGSHHHPRSRNPHAPHALGSSRTMEEAQYVNYSPGVSHSRHGSGNGVPLSPLAHPSQHVSYASQQQPQLMATGYQPSRHMSTMHEHAMSMPSQPGGQHQRQLFSGGMSPPMMGQGMQGLGGAYNPVLAQPPAMPGQTVAMINMSQPNGAPVGSLNQPGGQDYATFSAMTGNHVETMPHASPHYSGEMGVGYPNAMPLCRQQEMPPPPGMYGHPRHPSFAKPDYRRFCFSVGKADVPYAAVGATAPPLGVGSIWG